MVASNVKSAPAPAVRRKKANVYHHGDLREALIAAGARVLANGDASAFSIHALAKTLGVTHAAAYRHFRDRVDLLAGIAQAGLDVFAAGALRLRDEHLAGAGLRALHGALAKHYVNFAIDHPGYFRAIFHPDLRRLGAKHPLMQSRAHRFAELVGFFSALEAEGLLSGATAEEAAFTHWGLVHGFATLVLEGQWHGKNPADAAAKAARLLECGVLRTSS